MWCVFDFLSHTPFCHALAGTHTPSLPLSLLPLASSVFPLPFPLWPSLATTRTRTRAQLMKDYERDEKPGLTQEEWVQGGGF